MFFIPVRPANNSRNKNHVAFAKVFKLSNSEIHLRFLERVEQRGHHQALIISSRLKEKGLLTILRLYGHKSIKYGSYDLMMQAPHPTMILIIGEKISKADSERFP